MDTDTTELSERRLSHGEQAEEFYQQLKPRNVAVRVGMRASGHARWFELLCGQAETNIQRGVTLHSSGAPKDRSSNREVCMELRLRRSASEYASGNTAGDSKTKFLGIGI